MVLVQRYCLEQIGQVLSRTKRISTINVLQAVVEIMDCQCHVYYLQYMET